MAPDTKPGHGEKPKSPEKKPETVVKPDMNKKPGISGPQAAKPGGATKR